MNSYKELLMKPFTIYGTFIANDHIENEDLLLNLRNDHVKILHNNDGYIFGMSLKEDKKKIENVQTYDLKKMDFKQIEKQLLNHLSIVHVDANFLEFHLFSGGEVM